MAVVQKIIGSNAQPNGAQGIVSIAGARGLTAANKISYTLSENSKKMMKHGIARATEILKAAGAQDILTEGLLSYAGWHLMGTARMGINPKQSGVNEWGRCHDVKNLFIVDGSVFVTSGGVNPTSTIQALSLYFADQMKSRLSNLFD